MITERQFIEHTVHAKPVAVNIVITYLLFCTYQLNDFMCLNVTDIPSNSTCTSRPQTWHIPRSTSICPLPVMGTHFARAETDKRCERKRNPCSKL